MANIVGTIKGVNYASVKNVEGIGEGWLIDPTDLNGNVLTEMTIEAETQNGELYFYLPATAVSQLDNFSLNNNLNFKLTIANPTGTLNDIIVIANEGSIGGSSSLSVNEGGNLVLSPLVNNQWSAVKTQY